MKLKVQHVKLECDDALNEVCLVLFCAGRQWLQQLTTVSYAYSHDDTLHKNEASFLHEFS